MNMVTINNKQYARFRDSYYVCDAEGNVYSTLFNKLRKLKPIIQNSRGCRTYYVELNINGVRKKFIISRVIWESFYGAIPDTHYVGHKNGAKSMNDLNNLILLSKIEKCINMPRYRLIIDNDTGIIYKGARDAAKNLYVSTHVILRCCNNQYKKRKPLVNVSWYTKPLIDFNDIS